MSSESSSTSSPSPPPSLAERLRQFTDRIAHEAFAHARDLQVGRTDLTKPFRMTEDDLARGMNASRDTALSARKRLIGRKIVARGDAPGWFKLLVEVGQADPTIDPGSSPSSSDLALESKTRKYSEVGQADLALKERARETTFILELFDTAQPGRMPSAREIEVVRKKFAGISWWDAERAVAQARYLYEEQKKGAKAPWAYYLNVAFIIGPSNLGTYVRQWQERIREEHEDDLNRYGAIWWAREQILKSFPLDRLFEMPATVENIQKSLDLLKIMTPVEESPALRLFARHARERKYEALSKIPEAERWANPKSQATARALATLDYQEMREIEREYWRMLGEIPEFKTIRDALYEATFAELFAVHEIRTLVARMIRWHRNGARRLARVTTVETPSWSR